FVLEKTPKPHRDDHILHLRLQYAAQSTTCLGLPKNWETGKKASSNSRSGASGCALEHAASGDEKSEEKLMPPETNFSITSGIQKNNSTNLQKISIFCKVVSNVSHINTS
ncbi:MAG: hypothetical protein RL235_100, partial [Chlamydiota bacterium]